MAGLRYKALIFDMDGTITVPSLDFNLIRRELGILEGDIVKVIESWTEPRRREAWAKIEKYEEAVCAEIQFQEGARDSLLRFKESGLRLGLLTRNTERSVSRVLSLLDVSFDAVLTREYPFIKPSPEPVLHMLEAWNISPIHTLVIGDYIHDIECGNAAGAATCFFENPGVHSYADHADCAVSSFKELELLVRG